MNNSLLDNCLALLHSIKDDPTSLKKLLEFMEEEFVSQTPSVRLLSDYKLQIDEKYRPLIKEVAEYLEMNCIVYVNPESLEIDFIPKDYDSTLTDIEFDFDKVEDWIEIEPLVSHESYKIMESFVESLPAGKEKNKLTNAIIGHKPFANFNRLIHDSDERENWFMFRSNQFEKYVIDSYLEEIQQKYQNKTLKN
jgi:hypothetical protein